MNTVEYYPIEKIPFQIKVHQYALIQPTKKFSFFHAIRFFSRIYTQGGRWFHTAIFLIFKLFLFLPVAIFFDILILIIAGLLIGSGYLLLYIFKKIINILGVPATIVLVVATIIILATLIYFNFNEIVNFINLTFNNFRHGKF